MVSLSLDIKGVLNVNLIEGTIKLLGAFRAEYKDPKVSWTNFPIYHKSKKSSITCGEVLIRQKQDKTALNNDYPDN